MGGVTVREYGLSFVGVCLKHYIGKSWPILVIFLAGIVVSVILSLRRKPVENPLEVVTVDGKDRNMKYGEGDYEEEPDGNGSTWTFYYRFFWVIPITFGAAYYLTKAVSVIRKPLIRAIVSLAMAAALAVLIPVNPGLTNLTLPTNVYKVNGAIPVLCDAIHADFETTQTYQKAAARSEKVTDRNSGKWLKRQSRTYPLCVFPYELEFAVRQYDPTVRLLFNRNLRLFYEGNRTTGITYDESKKRYQRRALILDAMYGRNEEITTEDFQTAMEKTKTKYLIVEEHLANGGFLVQAGCRQVSVVAGYTIFRYGD